MESVRKGLGLLLVALILAGGPAWAATNYLMNADMETHWGHTPVLNLQYTGPGSDCRINVDVANGRLQTYVDSVLDLDLDLSDRPSYEEQFLLKQAIEATGSYVVNYPGWNGLNRGGESYSPTTDYSDVWNGLHNLKTDVGSIPEGLPSYWAGYGTTTSGACMFAHSGSYSLQVYDNRPSAVPGSPVGASPESVNMNQNIVTGNPDHWNELVGQEVKLSGYAYMPENSYQNSTVDQGYTVRVHHGAGGASVADFSSNPGRDQWVYFENTFTIDPGSDTILVVLMANLNPNHVYAGQGTVYFDDLALEIIPEPATMALLGLGGLAVLRRRRR